MKDSNGERTIYNPFSYLMNHHGYLRPGYYFGSSISSSNYPGEVNNYPLDGNHCYYG